MSRIILSSLLAITLTAAMPVLAQNAGPGSGDGGNAGVGSSTGAGGQSGGITDAVGGTSGGTAATTGGGSAGTTPAETTAGGPSTGGASGTASNTGAAGGTGGGGAAGAGLGNAIDVSGATGAPATGGPSTSSAGAVGAAVGPASSTAGGTTNAATVTSTGGAIGIGQGVTGGSSLGTATSSGPRTGSANANLNAPEAANLTGSLRDGDNGPGERSWLLPAALVPVAGASDATRTSTLDALQRLEPLRGQPGASLAIVSTCRDSIIAASRAFGVVRVDATSAGLPRKGRKGAILAPIEARVVYQRSNDVQLREARVTCHVSGSGVVTAIR